jgi:type IV pilus assembly protein PilE
MKLHRRNFGFTLIELMIAIAIIGILASIAIPSYSQYIIKTRRVDAQSELIQEAQAMERYFTANGRYTTTAGGTTCGVSTSLNTNVDTYYTISRTCPSTGTTFTLTATPVATKMQKNDGTLILDNTGSKSGSVNSGQWAS